MMAGVMACCPLFFLLLFLVPVIAGQWKMFEKAGEPVRLGDRAFDILLILIGQSADIVSKATLLALVWPNVTVEEGSLLPDTYQVERGTGRAQAQERAKAAMDRARERAASLHR